MKKPTSYICEHTAEYVLVPELKKIFQKEFNFVTPVYPWLLREGSKLSKEIHNTDKFRIFGLYPRRPKLEHAKSTNITININHELIVSAKTAMEYGIPLIAGYPLANNFWELGNKPNCIWIELCERTNKRYYFEVDNGKIKQNNLQQNNIFINDNDLTNKIINKCNIFSLTEVLDIFKKIKYKSQEFVNFQPLAFIGGYKPVYFFMK